MQSLILFGSPTKLTNSHKLVTTQRGQPEYYVRAQVVPIDFETALLKCGNHIMEGETILNTIPIDKPTKPIRNWDEAA